MNFECKGQLSWLRELLEIWSRLKKKIENIADKTCSPRPSLHAWREVEWKPLLYSSSMTSVNGCCEFCQLFSSLVRLDNKIFCEKSISLANQNFVRTFLMKRFLTSNFFIATIILPNFELSICIERVHNYVRILLGLVSNSIEWK